MKCLSTDLLIKWKWCNLLCMAFWNSKYRCKIIRNHYILIIKTEWLRRFKCILWRIYKWNIIHTGNHMQNSLKINTYSVRAIYCSKTVINKMSLNAFVYLSIFITQFILGRVPSIVMWHPLDLHWYTIQNMFIQGFPKIRLWLFFTVWARK